MRRRARLLSNRVSVVLEVVLAVLPPVAKAARPAPVQTAQPAVCVIVRELVLRAPRGLIVQVLVIYLTVRYGEVPSHPEPLRERDNVRTEVADVRAEVEDARPVGSHPSQYGRARRRAVGHLSIMCLSELDRARSETADARQDLRMCLGELDRARGETVDVRRRCRRHVGPEVVDHQQHHIGPGAAHRRARPDESGQLGPDLLLGDFAVIGDCVQVDCVRWGQICRAAAGGSGFDATVLVPHAKL